MENKGRLRTVKRKLVEMLGQGELEENQYWQKTYQLLLEQGIVEGPYENRDTTQVTVTLATKLMPKLPAENPWGLEKRYVSLKGKKLSEEAKEDLKKYSELERNTNNYLREKLKKKPILESEFNKIVADYLMNQTDLPNMVSERKQEEAIIRVGVSLQRKFKVQKDPKKIGRYDLKGLESSLDNL